MLVCVGRRTIRSMPATPDSALGVTGDGAFGRARTATSPIDTFAGVGQRSRSRSGTTASQQGEPQGSRTAGRQGRPRWDFRLWQLSDRRADTVSR